MIEHKYSTFWPRLFAGFIDGLVLLPLSWLDSFTFWLSSSIPLRIFESVLSASLCVGYSIWLHGKYGQTLGKMACKVIVLDVSENRLTMKQAVMRDIFSVIIVPIGLLVNISRLIHGNDPYDPMNLTAIDKLLSSSTLIWFLIEIITMLTNSKRRALHDFIAGSVVIRKPVPTTQPAVAPATA